MTRYRKPTVIIREKSKSKERVVVVRQQRYTFSTPAKAARFALKTKYILREEDYEIILYRPGDSFGLMDSTNAWWATIDHERRKETS